jgi:hypothetical protein
VPVPVARADALAPDAPPEPPMRTTAAAASSTTVAAVAISARRFTLATDGDAGRFRQLVRAGLPGGFEGG